MTDSPARQEAKICEFVYTLRLLSNPVTYDVELQCMYIIYSL